MITKRDMTRPSFGLAVDMLNPEARAIAFDVIPKLRPTVSYGMDDYHQTHLLWEATNRETLMLYRHHYGKYEDEWWHWTPGTWINHFTQLDNNVKQFGKDYSRDLIHLFLNEPKDITNRSEQYTDFVIEVLKWGKNNGFRFAFPIPNAEVEWSPLMIEGKFDRLLKAYDDEGFRQHGHIGFIHEYTLFHINEGMAASRVRGDWTAMWPDAFLYPEKMTPDNWATKEEVENLWPSNYTGGRGMRVNHRMMDALQRDPIPLVSSEGIWDKTPHLENWKDPRTGVYRNIYREVVDHYGVKPNSPHMDFAGGASLEALYRKMLLHVDWTKPDAFATAIIDQPRHLHKVLPDYYIGFIWFQLDPKDPRWDINGGYSPHRIPGVWDELYDWQAELKAIPPDPTPPTDSFEAYAIRGQEFANVRSATIVNPGSWLGRLTNGERCTVLEQNITGLDGNLWARIRKADGLEGYVSQTVIGFQPLTVNPAPPQDVVMISQAEYNHWKSQSEAIATLVPRGMMETGAAIDEIWTPIAKAANELALDIASKE